MSDQTDPAPVADQQPDAAPQPDAAQTDDQQQPDEDTFDAARALEKIRKANSEAKALRERAKAAEDATASAEQKAKDLEAQAARVPDLEAQLIRERVARKANLPDGWVGRLRGTTEAEVLADAEMMLADIEALKRPMTKQSGRPVEALQPGTGTPADTGRPAQLTRADLAAMSPQQIETARVGGQLADLMAGKST